MKYPARVKIVDVSPRDGLQNEPGLVPTQVKVGLIDRLSDAGLQSVEAGSFVSPKWVPQMADSADVMARIRRKPGVAYPVLVPNMKGLEGALAAKADEIAIFAAATEAFSGRNTNCTIAEAFERFEPVCRAALDNGVRIRGYVLEYDEPQGTSPKSARRCHSSEPSVPKKQNHQRRNRRFADTTRQSGGRRSSHRLQFFGIDDG